MSIFNLRYSDLLASLALTNTQFTIISVILIIFCFVIYFIIKLAVFSKVEVYRDRRNQMHIIYKNYQGNYKNIFSQFEKVGSQMEGLFAISRTFGIYYDNPQKVEDQNLCRAVIGILVNQGQRDKASLFTEKYPEYSIAYLPKAKFLVTQFPYFNDLTFVLLKFRVYPKLEQKHRQQKKNLSEQKIETLVQIYHFLSWQSKKIEIMTPLQHLQQFFLWKQPKKNI